MVNYKCDNCNKEFKQKCDYVRHINRKNKCISVLAPIDSRKAPIDSSKTLKDSPVRQNQCQNCKKVFSKNSNLCRHIDNKICYTEKDLSMIEELRVELKEELKKEFEDTVSKLLKKVEDLEKKNNLITVTNNNSHNTTHNTDNSINNNIGNINNIIMVNYGKEDISKLDPSKILKCIKGGFDSTLKLTEVVHFNPDHPEYHNVYISNMKNKYAMVYKDGEWSTVVKKDLIEKLYEDKKNYIEENIDTFYDSLTKSQKNSLNRWLETDDEHERINKIKEDIKLLLFNKRNIPLKTRDKIR